MLETTRLSKESSKWADFKQSVVPYVERSVGGPWMRRYLFCAIAFWLVAVMVSLVVTHSSSTGARDLREFYRLEAESSKARAWHQCGFCAVVDSAKRAKELSEDLADISDKELEACALAGGESRACANIPWPARSVLRDQLELDHYVEQLVRKSAPREKLDAFVVQEEFRFAVQVANFRPRIEIYRSPLDWSDFPIALGLTCSLLLLFGAIIVLPFRVVVLVGRELYHQTWILLVATQQPVSRILLALVLQALTPLALIAAPLLLTSVAMMVYDGQILAAVALCSSLVTLSAVWSAFGVTLPALVGRHVAPSFLTLFSLAISGIYFLVVLVSGDFVVNSNGDMLPRLWLHSGLDFWAGAQAGFGVVSEDAFRYWGPNFARSLAQLVLIPTCVLWVVAHAHRCQPERVAGLSRRAWVSAWTLAGLVLGIRCFAGVEAVSIELGDFGDWTWRRLGLYAVTALVVPLTSYLTTSAHPLSHRPQSRIGFSTWAKTSISSGLAVGFVWLGQVMGICLAGACDLADLVTLDGVVAAILVLGWCVLMSGVSLLLARGLRTRRAKFEFFGAALLGLSLIPALIFACTASEYALEHDRTFSVPSFVGFEAFLYLAAVGIVALSIRSTRPKIKEST